MKTRFLLALSLSASLLPAAALAKQERFSVIFGQKTVGHLIADTEGTKTAIDFDYKNNGRGPTMKEELQVDANGLPTSWTLTGATTFGSKVRETFSAKGGKSSWVDSTGPGSAVVKERAIYVAQSGSPWSLGLYARALLKRPDHRIPALPGGTLALDKVGDLSVSGAAGSASITAYALSGIDTTPSYFALDADGALFAYMTPDFAIVREGYEQDEAKLRAYAEKLSTARYVDIQQKTAHRYGAPVRIRNVRVFQPMTKTLSDPVSVVVNGRTIAAVEPLDSPSTPGEVTIDGAGGTLLAGFNEMHGHIGQDDALLNLVAGITTVRDMGNDNAVLDTLIDRIETGAIGGPRVVRSGFLEGKSPFNANNGIIADSEAAAVDAVRWYGARGYWQIKIYNSMNPAWVPAIVKEAHKLGMRVAGHVPAFATADQMIAAGYDEMTHINQFMLGWVIKPTEDTRTLFRLTALKRLPGLNLASEKVQHTIGMMVDRKVAIDPTLGIHELLLLGRDGTTPQGAVDYIDHLPVGAQRDLKKAMIDASAPGDDAAYRGAYDKIIATTKLLNDRGVFIVPGTDTGGAFTYHRELELMQKLGMTPGQILSRATYETARYMGRDQMLGSIEKGKLADFMLLPGDPTKDLKAIKTIALVAKDGAFYYPAEIYPSFGITPFADAPKVTLPGK